MIYIQQLDIYISISHYGIDLQPLSYNGEYWKKAARKYHFSGHSAEQRFTEQKPAIRGWNFSPEDIVQVLPFSGQNNSRPSLARANSDTWCFRKVLQNWEGVFSKKISTVP